VRKSNGQTKLIRPGETIETVYIPADTGMTKIADTPYYNPLGARYSVTSTGVGDDKTVTLDVSLKYLYIYKVTATVSVFYASTSNTPAVAILRAGDRYQHDLDGRADQLVLQFASAGTCEILQSNEEIE
jgi:hypothetical protein